MATIEEPEIDEIEEEVITDLRSDDVMNKYKTAAEIANKTLAGVITMCVDGKSVLEICNFGDALITGQCSTTFKSKKMDKGVAFPTCISVNECVGHFSPLKADTSTLKTGDVVKIDLGCHIDGFIAVVAHTLVVGADGAVEGKLADVLAAGFYAQEVAHKLLQPGNTNTQVTAAVNEVCETFGVSAVQGVLSHQLKQYVIDGNKVISGREDKVNLVDECTFEENEVYAMDIVLSTGDGKPRASEDRTTVYKRAVDKTYRLKMKASRYVFNEVNKHFPTLPFTLRAFDDETQARMGVSELAKHEMLTPYPVIYEKAGDIVVHFKFTVLITKSGADRVTGSGLHSLSGLSTDKKITEATNKIMGQPAKKKKKRKKKKKNKAA